LFPYNIVLIGFMGSGKTSVGKYLAQTSGYEYYDVDHIIEQQAGQSIAGIFSQYGEAYFRSMERNTVEHVSQAERAVISCGGGVVLDEMNVIRLKQKGRLVWLQAKPETLYERIKDQHDRPLADNRKFEDINKLLQARLCFYSSAADYEITTDGRPIAEVGQGIITMLTR
jgi:shikimate kinase